MEFQVIEGITYKVLPYLESNRLVYLYSAQGKVTLHARGAQKMTSDLRIASQYFNHIQADVEIKEGLIPVSRLKILNDFQNIKVSFDTMTSIAWMLEIIDKCVNSDDPHPLIYQALLEMFQYNDVTQQVCRFIIQLLKYIGYDIPLKADGRHVTGFNIAQASLTYQGDTVLSDISMDILILLVQLKHTNYDTILKISSLQIQEIKNFLIAYIEYHVHVKIKNR
jgi:DNA repair protein RecO (recombination protein O)